MYGRRICANGIWFGRHLLSNIVGLMASVGILASAISRGYLFVIAQKDLNHGIQQIGTHIPTQKADNEFGGDLYIHISASELMGSKNKILRKVAWIVGVLVTLILSIGFAITWRRHSAVGALEEFWFCFQRDIAKFNNYSSEENEKSTASYGKLLFEIVSGRRNISMLDDEICNYFPARVAIAMSKGEDHLTLLDHKLDGSANMEELTRACTVACWCIQDDPRDRPTMGQVVKILEGVMHVCIPQIPLYFQRLSENPTEAIVFHETATSLSSY
uniref:Uncharacterized protein n=1 Tax=Fagus sylvatica TaxID=28930 RepID=A0A2N9IB65_FAGSY